MRLGKGRRWSGLNQETLPHAAARHHKLPDILAAAPAPVLWTAVGSCCLALWLLLMLLPEVQKQQLQPSLLALGLTLNACPPVHSSHSSTPNAYTSLERDSLPLSIVSGAYREGSSKHVNLKMEAGCLPTR